MTHTTRPTAPVPTRPTVHRTVWVVPDAPGWLADSADDEGGDSWHTREYGPTPATAGPAVAALTHLARTAPGLRVVSLTLADQEDQLAARSDTGLPGLVAYEAELA